MDDAVPRIQDIPRPVPDAEGTGLDGWTGTRHDVDEIAFCDIGRELHAVKIAFSQSVNSTTFPGAL